MIDFAPRKTMEKFPSEFSQLTRPSLWACRGTITPIIATESRVRWFPLALRPAQAASALTIIERRMAQFLRPVHPPLNPSTIAGMKENYAETLPKTLRNSTIDLNSTRSAAYAEARRIGLIDLLGSASLSEFAALVTGLKLKPDPAMQLIRYRHGDFVGPHNDHHPEEPNLRDGYVDLQITLCSSGVERQYLLHESGGYFNKLCNVGLASGIAVSLLPVWHQVTPLETKPGRERDAHRWLLLASFEIAPGAIRKSQWACRPVGSPARR
jgi:hypothetical protein